LRGHVTSAIQTEQQLTHVKKMVKLLERLKFCRHKTIKLHQLESTKRIPTSTSM